MHDLDDNALLREYVAQGSEEAFAALVSRHINQVYSVALRHTRNPHRAEEVTQSVFVLLAEKSNFLGKGVILAGWLYQTARLSALNSVRGEIRRARREQEAQMQIIVNESKPDVWPQIAPLLDAAISCLSETDREAVVLRFFYEKSMKEVGESLGKSENAATVRLHRALEKLRRYFMNHGVNSTTDIIAGVISSHCIQAAPATLASAVTVLAVAKGTASGGTILALAKGGGTNALTWLKTTTFAAILANGFLSQKIVATHFNFAGNPDYWMTQSQSALVWFLVGCGFPLFFVAIGYSVRFGSISQRTFNIPNRAYWLAPERMGATSAYVLHQYLWLAFYAAIFMLAQMLLQIQANHQSPPHLSTPLALGIGGCFLAAAAVRVGAMLLHFSRVPTAPKDHR